MEIIITLRDAEDGQVAVEEVRLPYPGETEKSVTVATALADEMLSLMDNLGETE